MTDMLFLEEIFPLHQKISEGYLFPSRELDPHLLNDCRNSFNTGVEGLQQHLNSILSV